MVKAGVAATSAILTWQQCSEGLQDQLQQHGLFQDFFVTQYELGESREAGHRGVSECLDAAIPRGPIECLPFNECGDSQVCPGDTVCGSFAECPPSKECGGSQVCADSKECPPSKECGGPQVCLGETSSWTGRPSWLPEFVQHRAQLLPSCATLGPLNDSTWCPLWRRVVDKQTNVVIEDSPVSHHILDFEKPLDLWVSWWGLPVDFVRLASLSSHLRPPLRVNKDGQPCSSGSFWIWHSNDLSQETISETLDFTSEVGSMSDLKRCALNLCFLARQGNLEDSYHVDFVELFSPPRVLPHAAGLGLKVDREQVFDLTSGWDVRKKEHRQKFREFQKRRTPSMTMASPVCKAFSPLMAINKGRMDPKLLRKNLTEGRLMWDFSLEAIEEQCNENRYFGLEHPERASSWKLPKTQRTLQRPDVAVIIFDMCSWGLTVADDELSRKSTRIATNNPWLAYELMLAQCDGLHSHRHLIGGLPALAQEYPPELCKCIARSTKKAVLQEAIPSFIQSSFSGFEDEEEIPDDIPENDQGSFEPDIPRVSESQKRLIHRVHVNVGHPPRDRFLRALRAAGALPHVLQYVRNDFRCDDCEVRHGPAVHRKASFQRPSHSTRWSVWTSFTSHGKINKLRS